MSVTDGTATWHSQWPRRLLIAMHLPIVTLPVVFVFVGSVGPAAVGPQRALVVGVAAAILWIQLRHSLAAARGTRSSNWHLTLALLFLLVDAPLPFFAGGWADMQIVVVASVLMLLRGWHRLIGVPSLVAAFLIATLSNPRVPGARWQGAFDFVGAALWTLAVGVALFAAARLVHVLGELHATRAELAELAIGRERLRVSRDLHDLLGQSLSAISLKGDLAIRLLDTDPPTAEAEIDSLTVLARTALRDVRSIARDTLTVSLAAEADGAAGLLATAGINTRIAVDLPALSPGAEQMLAWALREAVTNVLRHSEARTCSITATATSGNVRLEVVNDRAHPPAEGGTGLAGLTYRARALAGSVTASPTADGGFRLLVLVPHGDATLSKGETSVAGMVDRYGSTEVSPSRARTSAPGANWASVWVVMSVLACSRGSRRCSCRNPLGCCRRLVGCDREKQRRLCAGLSDGWGCGWTVMSMRFSDGVVELHR